MLKVRLKELYKKLHDSAPCFKKTDKYPEVEANHQVDADSDDQEIGQERCTCNCSCRYDHLTDSASGVLDTHSAASERSVTENLHANNNNLECIKDDTDGEQCADNSDRDSVSSESSSEDNTSQHIIDFTPPSDEVTEPSDTPLKIPSIVITPVDPAAKLSSNNLNATTAYNTLLNSEVVDQKCDSGKGSSEINAFTCPANDTGNSNHPSPPSSSSSLSTNSSGVFSDSLSKAGVYVNGGFIPSTPRKTRSQSEDVGSSSYISLSIGNNGIRRLSRSLTDLGLTSRSCKYKYLSERKLNSLDYNGKVESFCIHTKVFDDMMKS